MIVAVRMRLKGLWFSCLPIPLGPSAPPHLTTPRLPSTSSSSSSFALFSSTTNPEAVNSIVGFRALTAWDRAAPSLSCCLAIFVLQRFLIGYIPSSGRQVAPIFCNIVRPHVFFSFLCSPLALDARIRVAVSCI